MIDKTNIISLLIAYLIGAIPTAVWIGRTFYDIDVREYGSGNAGATNTFRVLGKKAGIPVLIIDIFKGWLAVRIANYSDLQIDSNQYISLQLVLGVAALIGHIFPVFVGFRGGKGIATLVGIMLAVHPYGALAAIILFVVVLIITKYVSLGSIISAICFPFLILFYFKETSQVLILFSFLIAILVIITHQKNIQRLIRGEENKTYLFGRRKK